MTSSTVSEPLRDCARLIDAIGTDGFGRELLSVVHAVAGVDHVVAYALDHVGVVTAESHDGGLLARDNAVAFVDGGHWRHDPAVRAARVTDADALSRVEPTAIVDPETRERFYARARVREKLFVSGARAGARYGLSAFRSVDAGPFTPDAVARVDVLTGTIVSCVAKHAAITSRATTTADLSSVPRIEARLRRWGDGLTMREIEVLARILFGLSVTGMALDLGIGEESVATYRKRAFRRLRIATRQELLTRFLSDG